MRVVFIPCLLMSPLNVPFSHDSKTGEFDSSTVLLGDLLGSHCGRSEPQEL